MNTVILAGRLTRDAKEFTTTGGAPVAVFTLAVPNGPKSTSYIPCKLLGKTVKGVLPYLVKGKLVNFSGSLDVYNHTSAKMPNGYPVVMFNVTGWAVELLDGRNNANTNTTTNTSPMGTANTVISAFHNNGKTRRDYNEGHNAAQNPVESISADDINDINAEFEAAAEANGLQFEDDHSYGNMEF